MVIREVYDEIKKILINTDTINIFTQDNQSYLGINCSNATTFVALLDDSRYHFKSVEYYSCGVNFKKEMGDQIVLSLFNDLKRLNNFTPRYPLTLNTKINNNQYIVELTLLTKYLSTSEVRDLWDSFNHFTAQLNGLVHNQMI
jgi:glutaredoxin-related protein